MAEELQKDTSKPEQPTKKPVNKKKRKKVALITTGAIVAVLGITYGVGAWYFGNHYQLNTTINGKNYQGKTVGEVKQLISDSIADYKLDITERDGSVESIVGKDIELAMVYDSTLDDAMASQEALKWPLALFNSQNVDVKMTVSYDETKLASLMDNLTLFDKDSIIKPVAACISDYDKKNGYTIVKEDIGNQPKTKDTQTAITDCIESLTEKLNVDESGLYKEPKVYADNEKLIALCEKMNKYIGVKITYTFGSETETLDGSTINKWLDVDDTKKFKVSVDEDKAYEYVADLASAHDTVFRKHTFKTHNGSTIDITRGDYGWWTNKDDTTAELIKDLDDFKSGEKTVVYRQKAASYEGNDYGNTYAEVNLGAQYMYFVVDGVVQMSSSFVSGNTSNGHGTPSGIYSVTYKKPGQRMVGADYDVYTDFWMPFNGDIGFHDATWRSRFGGSIYKTNGSHGCVNLPYSAAKKLYSLISTGDPVICYY